MVWETGCPPLFPYYLSFLFILTFTLSPVSTCKLNFLRFKTCHVSPYLEWLGVVVKAEEHGLVRCRVLYCSTWAAPALCSPFLLGALWDTEHKVVLGHIFRPFWTSIVRPRQYLSSAQALDLNIKWAGVINSLPYNNN